VTRFTWRAVTARRLQRSHLRSPLPTNRLVDAVRDTCGVQAQLLPAAELAISARVEGTTREDVRAELWERRGLAKVASLRSTIHVHAADDVPLWFAALRAVGWWREGRWLRDAGATLEQLHAVTAAARDALDRRALTRRELDAEVIARVGRWAAKPLGWQPFAQPTTLASYLVNAYEGGIGFGPNRGNEVTFVRLDQWLADWRELDPEDALREAARRYLRTYGPARPDDFGHWMRLGLPEARAVFGALRRETAEVDIEGHAAWVLRGDARPSRAAAASVRLVPDYDCYVIGAAPPGPARQFVVPKAAGTRVFDRGGGPFAALLVDGVVAGVWKRRPRAKRIDVSVETFRRLSAEERSGLKAEAERVARFLGLDLALEVSRSSQS
jgi:hypothetical protein